MRLFNRLDRATCLAGGLLLITVFAPCVTRGQEATWRVGLARTTITPDEPVRMAGYSSRTEPSAGVALDLNAKALAVRDASGRTGLLIACDIIGFPAAFTEPTCRTIAQRTGLTREQIVLSASHTHTGPSLGLDAADLSYPPEQAEATVRYTRQLQEKLVALADECLDQLTPARLRWGVGVAPFVMNRREFTDRGVRLGVNPSGLADRSVPVLRIDAPDGSLRAVVYGTACHNTTLTGEHRNISGDFAGYSQRVIEQAKTGAQAMFVAGCAGDANPYPRGSEAISSEHGSTLGREVLRVLDADLQSIEGSLRTQLETVALPLQPPLTGDQIEALEESGSWRRFVAQRMKAILDRGDSLPTSYSAPFAVWQFGDDLTWVGLPGEVVVDYVTLLEDALGPRRLWISAYCNDVFGYLPSARVIDQGGYETRGLYAGGIGFFAPESQDVVARAVSQLARRAGRPADLFPKH